MREFKRCFLSVEAAALAIAFLTGCLGSDLEVPTSHPGNPLARSGILPAVESLSSEVPGGAPKQQAGNAATATRYTCPMHPEIVRNEPGKCPTCGMSLVPKKDKQ